MLRERILVVVLKSEKLISSADDGCIDVKEKAPTLGAFFIRNGLVVFYNCMSTI